MIASIRWLIRFSQLTIWKIGSCWIFVFIFCQLLAMHTYTKVWHRIWYWLFIECNAGKNIFCMPTLIYMEKCTYLGSYYSLPTILGMKDNLTFLQLKRVRNIRKSRFFYSYASKLFFYHVWWDMDLGASFSVMSILNTCNI